MIKNAIYRGRVRTVEDAIELWKASHDHVQEVHDIVVESSATLCMFIEWQHEAWGLLRSGALRNVLDAGAQFRRAYSVAEQLIGSVKGCIESATARGYIVDNAEKFRDVIKQVERMHKEFSAHWPFPNTAEMDANIAAIERGDCVDLGEWISDLQTEDSKEHSIAD
jgi:hypothetical protein